MLKRMVRQNQVNTRIGQGKFGACFHYFLASSNVGLLKTASSNVYADYLSDFTAQYAERPSVCNWILRCGTTAGTESRELTKWGFKKCIYTSIELDGTIGAAVSGRLDLRVARALWGYLAAFRHSVTFRKLRGYWEHTMS